MVDLNLYWSYISQKFTDIVYGADAKTRVDFTVYTQCCKLCKTRFHLLVSIQTDIQLFSLTKCTRLLCIPEMLFWAMDLFYARNILDFVSQSH